MDLPHHIPDEPTADRHGVYSDLLHSAEDVAARAVGRMRRLAERFPAAVPAPLLAHLERSRADRERRGAVRLDGDGARVTVRAMAAPATPLSAVVLDRAAGGLSLGVPVPLEAGAFLEVQWLTEDGELDWYPVQVRHARRRDDGWVVGCEFLGGRPPA